MGISRQESGMSRQRIFELPTVIETFQETSEKYHLLTPVGEESLGA
jgi:hypothetical protein